MNRDDVKTIIIAHFFFGLIMLGFVLLGSISDNSFPIGSVIFCAEGLLILYIVGYLGVKHLDRLLDTLMDKLGEGGFL